MAPPAAPPAMTAPPADPPADRPPADPAPPATPPPEPPIESVHRPTTHACARAPQSTQLAPFEPHALDSTPAEHCPSAAQHPEQFAALQTCGREGLQAAHISISHINQRIETPGRTTLRACPPPAQGGHRVGSARTSDFRALRRQANQRVRRPAPKHPRVLGEPCWVEPLLTSRVVHTAHSMAPANAQVFHRSLPGRRAPIWPN